MLLIALKKAGKMKDIILKHVINEYGDNVSKEQRTKHYSYCIFPEEECTCKDLKEITYDTSLISGGYIDSFSMLSTLVFLQKTFNIKIQDKDAIPENFNTVNKMCELVKKYIK
jgi:acyl carrier protein